MSNSTPVDFFNKEAAEMYDEKNRQLAPIMEAMHFLTRIVLRELPDHARVLCVGVGTGAELLSLSKAFPNWTFVAVEPSASMLNLCSEKLKAAGVIDRCELIHGYVHDAPPGENFDAALTVLVAHFVKHEERLIFYRAMIDRLSVGGTLVNAEISYDLNSNEFPKMLKNWEAIQSLMGATPESIASLPKVLKEMLTVISPAETESLLRQSGIQLPVHFFQAFMINGWYGRK